MATEVRHRSRRSCRSLILTFLCVALFQALALADELAVAGTYSGAFPVGDQDNVVEFKFGNYDFDLGIEYCTAITGDGLCQAAEGSFSGTATDTDPLALSLGSFRLWRPDPWQPQFYLGVPFQLNVGFGVPAGVGEQHFVASLWGLMTYSLGGFVNIDFQDNQKDLSFSNASASGTFTLRVNDLTIWLPPDLPCRDDSNVRANLTGDIRLGSIQSVPEPVAYEILGAGLFGAVLFLGRKSSRRG